MAEKQVNNDIETNKSITCLDILQWVDKYNNNDPNRTPFNPDELKNKYTRSREISNKIDYINKHYTKSTSPEEKPDLSYSPEDYSYLKNIDDFYDINSDNYNIDNMLSGIDSKAERVKLSNPPGTNWCYVNVVLQLFLHIEDLWLGLLFKFGKDKIRTTIREEYSKFAGIESNDQCDAVLLLNWLLDNLDDYRDYWSIDWCYNYRCIDCNMKSKKTVRDNIWYIYPHESKPYIDSETGKKYTYDLGNCTHSQTKGTLEKKCDNCNLNTKHVFSNYIDKYPQNIFMNLQQFTENSVYIYDCIELTNGSYKENNEHKTIEYDLTGFIVHIGWADFGHYKIYIRDTIGWRCYDDDQLEYIELDDILNNLEELNTIPLLWYTYSLDNNKDNKSDEEPEFGYEFYSPEKKYEDDRGFGYNSIDLT